MRRRIVPAFLLCLVLIFALLGYRFFFREGYSVPPVDEEHIISPRYDIILDDPYQEVNWAGDGRYKANLHTHTRESDGHYSPARVIDTYRRNGYDILAIADHNNVTWPWQDYGRDPEELGMLAIQANEISDTHHIGSYFNDFDIDGMQYRPLLWKTGTPADISEEEVIAAIGAKGGLAVFFHPGRYDYEPEYYRDFYLKHDHLVGMEVVNQRDRYRDDRKMWDEVLTLLMPDRPVWGFANDDMHIMKHLGHCYNTFLLADFTEDSFRNAMEQGRFYFSHGRDAPVIESIEIDNDGGTIMIDSGGNPDIVWYSDKRVIHHGDTLNFRETPNVGSYIRAKLIDEGGNTYTNPFGVRNIF